MFPACAFRHPTGGVAWESLLEHQHFVVKSLYELKHVNCAFRHPTGGVA